MTDTNDKQDKAIHAEANAEKSDLSRGTDTPIGDGSETTPVDANDKLAQRKALFSKSKGMRERRVATDAEAHPDAERMRAALEEEAGQGSSRNELDRGSHMDTNRQGRPTAEQLREEASGSPRGDRPATPIAGSGDRVKVKVLGQEYEVPKGDVEDAGGLVAYQKSRAASVRLQQAAKREAELKAERERLEQERREFEQQRKSAGRNAPASKAPEGTPGAAPTRQDGAGDGADVEAQAEAIVKDLYSGDPKRAKQALAQVLRAQSAPTATLDPDEVARQAAELLRQQDQTSASPSNPTPNKPKPEDPALQVEVDELNAMMATRFRDLIDNSDLKAQTLAEFQRMRALPENRHRRLVDIGREAALNIQSKGPSPRADVEARKRTLPPATTGSKPHRPSTPEAMDNRTWIERMREARGLPR